MFWIKVLSKCWVGPANSTNSNNAQARSMLMSDMTRTPLSTPATATMIAAPIISTIRPT
ncbi:hypothetical protein D9M68_952270 [compost metagenome]